MRAAGGTRRPPQAPTEALDEASLRRVWTLDLVFGAYYAGTVLVVLSQAGRIPGAAWIALGHAAAMALHLGLKRGARRSPLLRALWLVLPFALVLATFTSLGWIIPHLRVARYDAALAAWDLRLLGSDPTRWLEPRMGRGLAGLLQFCYTSYYFVPVVMIGLLWWRRRFRTIVSYAAIVVSCFFATYVGYYLVPARGPRSYLVYDDPLPLGPVAQTIHDLIDMLENIKLDAFPSGHTAISVLCLLLLFRLSRPLGWLFAPLIAGLILSTVALRYHYAVDVFAGLLIAVVWIVWVVPWILRRDGTADADA